MPNFKYRFLLFVVAGLFLASTVCGILDDQNIDRSYQNFTSYHACFATNCPICGAQYQAQDETLSLQHGIILASDELCTTLTLAYDLAWHRLDFACADVEPAASPPATLLSEPVLVSLRI